MQHVSHCSRLHWADPRLLAMACVGLATPATTLAVAMALLALTVAELAPFVKLQERSHLVCAALSQLLVKKLGGIKGSSGRVIKTGAGLAREVTKALKLLIQLRTKLVRIDLDRAATASEARPPVRAGAWGRVHGGDDPTHCGHSSMQTH
jgi:hypothetical protein